MDLHMLIPKSNITVIFLILKWKTFIMQYGGGVKTAASSSSSLFVFNSEEAPLKPRLLLHTFRWWITAVTVKTLRGQDHLFVMLLLLLIFTNGLRIPDALWVWLMTKVCVSVPVDMVYISHYYCKTLHIIHRAFFTVFVSI